MISLLLVALLHPCLGRELVSASRELRMVEVPSVDELLVASSGFDPEGYGDVDFDQCFAHDDVLQVGVASIRPTHRDTEFIAHSVAKKHQDCFVDADFAQLEDSTFATCFTKAVKYNAGAFDISDGTCYLSYGWRQSKVAQCLGGAHPMTYYVNTKNIYNFNPCSCIMANATLNGNGTILEVTTEGDSCGCYIEWVQMQFLQDLTWSGRFSKAGEGWQYAYTPIELARGRQQQPADLYFRPKYGNSDAPVAVKLIHPVQLMQ